MSAGAWIESVLEEFGRAAGLRGLALNARGAAAIRFDSGMELRFESARGELAVAVTIPSGADAASMSRLLSMARRAPGRRQTLRTGYLAKSGRAVFAVRIPERAATLPAVNEAFEMLRAAAMEFGGVQ